jgi:4-aminobutyrate aminotransferase
MGEYMMGRLADWPGKHRVVGQVRGRGLMIGLELVKSQETREANPEARQQVIEKAFHRGLLVLGCGASTVRLMPPLLIQREHADIALEILDGCLSEAEE